ncbi:hypothetical protein WP7W18E02_16950 [Aeromonas media]|nr:hypothetical protein WP7W18E02_16950 [Aeromonas media]
MLIRKNYALSAMVLALSSSVVWAETPLVAQRSDVTLSMANQLVQATLAACHAEGRCSGLIIPDTILGGTVATMT